jgi:septal ring factor EnvC (AmiA/AmiB activator)
MVQFAAERVVQFDANFADQPHFEKIGKQIGKSPKSNTAQNDQFKHLVKKYNLDRTQRNRLHERINKEGLSLKEIEKIIQDGDY